MNGSQMAMNNVTGGPVGAPPMNAQQTDMKMEINTYIYDHLLQTRQYDLARDFKNNNSVKTRPKGKPNGVSADMDNKDGPRRPDDLPDADVLPFQGNTSFLMEWWTMFWDLFASARRPGNGVSQMYLKQQRMRHEMMTQGPKMMMGGKTGMIPRGVNPQAAMMQQKLMAGQQMQRDPSQMDIAGQGPQTPGQSMDNAPSPSKRPRLDNGGFDGNMAGRQAQMAMGANGQLMQNGMTPQQMNSFGAGANGALKMEGINGMPPNSMNQVIEGAEFSGQGMGGGVDNKHALQDYQMQLMLLEQQNKKRLLAAKRDNPEPMTGGLGGAGPPGGFAQAPNMSPSGSRGAGPSPTPNDQMRKVVGTPKMPQQIPESPMALDQNRGSPAPNFDPSNPQMAHGVPQQFFGGMNGNPMARPPSSHPGFTQMPPQMEAQMRMNAARAGQPWPPGANPMMPGAGGQPQPQQAQPGQQPGMPNTQRGPGNMAPPPVPADQSQPQPRASESSPAQAPAPPTPSTKAAPKPKKETAAAKKKNQAKKGAAAAATPAADGDLPPTPTPSTPNATGQLAKQAGAPAAPANAPTAAGAQPGMDANAGSGLFTGMDEGGLNNTPGGFSLDFQGLDGSDVFENFDFDNFLNADGGDMSMEHISFGDGVEAGNV